MIMPFFFNLSYREKPNFVGATFQGKICDKQYGGGIVLVWYDLICLLCYINRVLFKFIYNYFLTLLWLSILTFA